MRRRICRVMAVVLAMTVLLAACGKQKNNGDDVEKNYEKLVIVFRASSVPSQDAVTKIEKALSEMTKEKIGVTVELVISSFGDYNQQLQLMLSGGDQVDVVGIPDKMVSAAVNGGQIVPIDDLLAKYGQGIVEKCGETLMRTGLFGDETYFTPYIADQGMGFGYYLLNKTLADKCGINVEEIDSYEDLEAAFATVHEQEPDVNIVVPRMSGTTSMIQNHYTYDLLVDGYGVLDNWGQSLEVVNLFETDSYREYVDRVHQWYLKGYISPDAASGILNGMEMMKANTGFCYSFNNKPGALEQEQLNCGCELYGVQLLPTLSLYTGAWQWAIGATSVNPGKAMQFLNLMYTDADFLNLLVYGIEGEDYEVREDGRIGYPEGVDSGNVEYSLAGSLWQFGNEFNAYVWESNDTDVWEQTIKWNKEGNPDMPYYVSKAYGFRFDSSSVANEMAAVSNIYSEYAMALENGASDPESTLKEMNKRLYAAGLQKIIDEKQRQLDIWAEAAGVK